MSDAAINNKIAYGIILYMDKYDAWKKNPDIYSMPSIHKTVLDIRDILYSEEVHK